MQSDDGDDWWLQSAPKANLFSDDDSNNQKGVLGTTLDSTTRLTRQLKDFDVFGGEDSFQSSSGSPGDPIIPLNKIISEATIDQIMRWERPDVTEQGEVSNEEKLLEEMLLGHKVSLQGCRSLRAKSNLLKGAVNSADGEIILRAVLHIMSTLSSKHSYKMLGEHPVAFRVYANYLSATNQHATLTTLLESLGKVRQAAVLHYYLANNSKASSASRQAQNIFTISSSHFNNDKYDKYLKQHVKLLELAGSLNLTSSVSAHDWLRTAAATSPVDSLGPLSTTVGISDKIYQWVCMKSLIAAGKYSDIQKIFKAKSWLGGDKIKALIPMSKVINEMEKAKVPRVEIEKYLKYIDDPMERRNLEAKLENYQF